MFGDEVPSPEGRPGWDGEEVRLHPFFLSALCMAESVLHVAFCLAAGAQLRPPSPLPRALRKLGCFGGPAGVPGLEERRAEWLTTFNFCFSVGLGWGIFFFHVSKFLLPLFEEPLLFILSFLLSILSEEPGLRLLWDVQKVAVPGSDADKPVGRGGACRCECCPVAWPEPSEHTNCTNSFSESCPWWWW